MNIDLVLKRLELIKEYKVINTISDTEASIILNEIERLREENLLLRASEPMSKLQEDYGYKTEVDRLNNNWNKLEKYLIEEISRLENVEQTPTIILITGKVEDILDELRNLKGDESDENII